MNTDTVIEYVYKSVTSGKYSKLKDALRDTNYEIGTIIPVGYGLNITIEPNLTMLNACSNFEAKKIMNVLFKYCGALHIRLELSMDNIGGVLYSNKRIGHCMFIQDNNKLDIVKSRISNSVLREFNIQIYSFKSLTEFFNTYYYGNVLTNFN